VVGIQKGTNHNALFLKVGIICNHVEQDKSIAAIIGHHISQCENINLVLS
jgi:hypothetical protein